VLTFRSGPMVGLLAQFVLLGALQVTVGLSVAAWVVGLVCGAVLDAAVAHALHRADSRLGPADLVTLTRATFACAVAALVVDSFLGRSALPVMVALTVVALVLDAVDGWVARRTRTASTFGARFDGETDAFLIAVLSVYVAQAFGWWVLAMGAARYVFAVAGWGMPWMRGQLPPRYWRKVVTAAAGIALTVAVADVLPGPATYAVLLFALLLLAESFGRDVWWLWRHRSAEDKRRTEPRHVRRPVWSAAINVLALLVVWAALVAPNRTYRMRPTAFLHIPVEGLVVAALALIVPFRPRRVMASVVGVLLALVTLLKLLDMGFFVAFDRPFNLASDRGYLGPPAIDLAKDTIGQSGAVLAVVGVVVLTIGVVVFMPLAVGRLTTVAARHRGWTMRVITALVVVSMAAALAGFRVPGGPLASLDASRLALSHVRAVEADAAEKHKFEAAVGVDHFGDRTNGDLLTGLRGKDVLIVFVESYGRVAIEGSPSSPKVRALLATQDKRLKASGYSSASAFLTSSTFGGLSWLAHGTLQSGLWVDNQPRYDELLSGNRLTLSRAFGEAGWRTVALLPSNVWKWPRGRHFYKYDKIYDRRDLGYQGQRFGFSKMPDQYALAAFQRLELSRPHRTPLMAEIDLASSHEPWAKLPRMVPWNRGGNGSIFNRVHGQIESVRKLWSNPANVEKAYSASIAYSLRALTSFVQTSGDKNLVMVLLGDHQPGTIVSGHGASRDVPISIIAHDKGVMDRIAGWGWQDGLLPGSQAPTWRMNAFRDRFFAAYSR
jgi:phosphatidylglycerophosphate synthase